MPRRLTSILATRLEKAALDNGFDLDLGRTGDWLAFGSTRTTLRIWLSVADDDGLALATDREDLVADLEAARLPSETALPDGAVAGVRAESPADLSARVRELFGRGRAAAEGRQVGLFTDDRDRPAQAHLFERAERPAASARPASSAPDGPEAGQGGAASAAGDPIPPPTAGSTATATGTSASSNSARSSDDHAFSSHTVVLRYPAPIALAYQRFCGTREAVGRAKALFDVVEATARYLTTILIADLFRALASDDDRAILDSAALAFLGAKGNMQLGAWLAAIGVVAERLSTDEARIIPATDTLLGLARGGPLDELVKERNRFAHPGAALAVTPADAARLIRRGRPLLEDALQRLDFLRGLPLALVMPRPGGERRYELFSCQGARCLGGERGYVFESPVPLAPEVPFVFAPGRGRILHLWPLLASQRSPRTQRPTLYAFEAIDGQKGAFLTRVRSLSIDSGEEWLREHGPQAASHGWLFERLGALPIVLDLPAPLARELETALAPDGGGRLVGQRLGPYRLEALVGTGGFGAVYAAATDEGAKVAVKVLDEGAVVVHLKRFQQEFKRLKEGEHRGIIRVFDSGAPIIGGREVHWYAMELATGGDLTVRIRARQRADALPWDDADTRREIGHEILGILDAVAHLHERGIVHRDIKPGNVLFTEGGAVRLSDFGLVKKLAPGEKSLADAPRSMTGAVLGTPHYMAPEQRRGEDVTLRADVYALGVLLAEIATGRRPERPKRDPKRSELAGWQPLGRLPPKLRALILACTDVDADRRPSNAGDVAARFRNEVLPEGRTSSSKPTKDRGPRGRSA